MKLAWKFFISYLLVVVIGSAVLVISTAYTAPVEFSNQMDHMPRNESGHGNQRMMSALDDLDEELDASFRDAVNTALLRSTIIATLAAILVSLYVSQRITQPIREVSLASQHIAAGDYDKRLHTNSQDELGDLIQNFNRMAGSLEQTETLRQQLIADVSHELKTPLASINAYLEGMQDGVLQPNDDTLTHMQQEVRRLQRLVQDLQQLSRAEAGQLHLKLQDCDGVAIAQSVAEWLRPQFEEKGVTLLTDLPDTPQPAMLDSDRISQVLLNLLSNGLQYTPSGGTVTLGLQMEHEQLHYSVKDTGVGLSEEALGLVFQRFYRVDKSRSRASGGSGIGLTIARHIVEAHGGRIWADSAGQNLGSTFHFTVSC